MAGWYRVVKTIKGHKYLYEQQTYREGGRVRTRNRYLGRAGGDGEKAAKPAHTPLTPLFTDPSDFGRALASQFDAPAWGQDAGAQLLGSPRPRLTIPPLPPVEEMIKDLSKTSKVTVIPGYGMIIDKKEETGGRLSEDRGVTTNEPSVNCTICGKSLNMSEATFNYSKEPYCQSCYEIWETEINEDEEEPTVILSQRLIEQLPPVTTTPASRAPASPEIPGTDGDQAERGFQGYSPRDVQAEITDKIIQAIETGQANGSFQMPWQAIASEGLPVNAVTHQPYHGVNVLILSLEALQREWPNQWASFQQWRERGASVKKGAHGVPIVFYSPVQVRDTEEDADGKKQEVVRTIPVFRYSTVFNIAQVDNPPVTTTPPDQVVANEEVEQFITDTKAEIRYGGNRAYFSPSSDYIQIPPHEAFTGTKTSSPTEAFYGTVLHELCHWTGGKARLNRETGKRFGDEAYAAEELIAEIGAAFACAQLGITPELRADHVQYVASWLKLLKEDKRAIFTASAAAAHAVEYLDKLQAQA